MLYRTVPKTGDRLSILGFGCMRLPAKSGGIDENRTIRQIRHAIDNGVNYFDTAPAYHFGKSEQILGRALLGGYREKVRIATKLPHWSVRERADMDRILAKQLATLQTDHIDYYLLHSLGRETGRNSCGSGCWSSSTRPGHPEDQKCRVLVSREFRYLQNDRGRVRLAVLPDPVQSSR